MITAINLTEHNAPATHPELKLFHENEDFNNSLDEEHGGDIVIAGESFRPSEILFRLAPEKYRVRLTEFREDENERLKEQICEEYPPPIAIHYHRFEYESETEQDRLASLRDTWEATIKFLFALILGEARFKKVMLKGHKEVKYDHLTSDRLSDRLLLINKVFACAAEQSITLEIASIVPHDVINRMRELNKIRNDISHREKLSSAQALQVVTSCQDEVFDILRKLEGLSKVRVMRYLNQEGALQLRYEHLYGAGRRRYKEKLPLTTEQLSRSAQYFVKHEMLAMVENGDGIFSLKPFVHFKEDASGFDMDVCFFVQKLAKGKLEFEVIGKSLKEPLEADVFKESLNEFRALFGLAPE